MSETLADTIRGMRRTLTAKEVSELLSVNLSTVYKMCHADRMPGSKVGGNVRFDCLQLADWYEKRFAVLDVPKRKQR